MIERILNYLRPNGKPGANAAGERAFAGADMGRLQSDWIAPDLSSDAALRSNIRVLRNRWRDLEKNNDYARRFLAEFQVNVIGPEGFSFRNMARNDDADRTLDSVGNTLIQEEWTRWADSYCDMSGEMRFSEMEQLAGRTMARDGEVILQMVPGANNPFRFALHILEADHLDEDLNRPPKPGLNEIRMGVEVDGWRRRVAYYIRRSHPGDVFHPHVGRMHERVPAENIIHLFVRERPGQTRGYPLGVSAIKGLRNLGAYEEAEVVAARMQASKGVFYESDAQQGGGNPYQQKDEQGRRKANFEPGMEHALPPGVRAVVYNPTHPNQNYSHFRGGMLKGISAGLISSYPTLAQDPAGINFSMIRAGLIIERDVWKLYQHTVKSQFHLRVFPRWLEMGMLSGAVDLPLAKFDKFNRPRFRGRRWEFVDPAREGRAAQRLIQTGLTSRHRHLDERNESFDEVAEELEIEQARLIKAGLAMPIEETDPDPNDTELSDDS